MSTKEELWQGYMSFKPSDLDLRSLVIKLNEKSFVRTKAWEELKKRRALKKELLIEVVLFGKEVSEEAWEELKKRKLPRDDLNGVMRCDSPRVRKEARKLLGRYKEEVLSEIRRV